MKTDRSTHAQLLAAALIAEVVEQYPKAEGSEIAPDTITGKFLSVEEGEGQITYSLPRYYSGVRLLSEYPPQVEEKEKSTAEVLAEAAHARLEEMQNRYAILPIIIDAIKRIGDEQFITTLSRRADAGVNKNSPSTIERFAKNLDYDAGDYLQFRDLVTELRTHRLMLENYLGKSQETGGHDADFQQLKRDYEQFKKTSGLEALLKNYQGYLDTFVTALVEKLNVARATKKSPPLHAVEGTMGHGRAD